MEKKSEKKYEGEGEVVRRSTKLKVINGLGSD
jgi:hypothetical protein